jgi:hypothetical protein
VYTKYLFIIILYIPLWIDDHNGEEQKCSRPEKPLEGRYIISEFNIETGEPLGPHKRKLVEHYWYLVRDRIPISIREWKKKINEPNVSFVSDLDKNLLWNDILQHFTLQADDYDDINDDELKELVRTWAMKNMATQFQTWKKTLYNTYVKKDLMPNFNTTRGQISKLRPYWNDFVEYKTSAEGEAWVRRNQENARKKVYHHDMGSGGYETAIPKWRKMEADIIAKGIEPESAKWPKRAKNWFFGHGGRLDPDTGLVVYGQKLKTAARRLAFAIQAKEIDAFKSNREKDELMYAIGTAEHTGRTRGLGRNTSWEHGFPNDRETYRSRQRSKEEQAARGECWRKWCFKQRSEKKQWNQECSKKSKSKCR